MEYARGYAEVRALDDQPNTIEAVISDATMDRAGDVVEQSGWQLDSYKKNPVVLWAHDSSIPPIGKAVDVRVSAGKLRATTLFATTPLAQEVFQLYRGGFLRSFSVGFKPLAFRPIRDDDGNVTGFRFMKQELLEYSAVSIPANPNAVVMMRSMCERGMLQDVARFLPPSVTGPTADEIETVIRRHLELHDALAACPTITRVLRRGTWTTNY
jgi:HK97 family phage prohead protease